MTNLNLLHLIHFLMMKAKLKKLIINNILLKNLLTHLSLRLMMSWKQDFTKLLVRIFAHLLRTNLKELKMLKLKTNLIRLILPQMNLHRTPPMMKRAMHCHILRNWLPKIKLIRRFWIAEQERGFLSLVF